jgi:hypothetical protein
LSISDAFLNELLAGFNAKVANESTGIGGDKEIYLILVSAAK